jgi:Zn-finger nucleic acid-binding protein
VEFRPQPVLSGGDPVACPACAIDLAPRSLAGLAVQECERCRGLWVPATNFDALVEHTRTRGRERATDGLRAATPPQVASGARVAYRHCPVCRQPMHRKNFGRVSGVVIDWCRADGTWLDANELAQIATFVSQGGLDRKATVEREEAQTAAMRQYIERLGIQATTPHERESSFTDLLTTLLT